MAFRDQISDYIPNPTFNRVAPPGGPAGRPAAPRAIPSVDAFFDPEPRLALMKDMGIDRALMWPTLASGIEERLWDDPDAIQAVTRALNRWMLEHWTFNFSDAIYPTPYISLSVLDDAIKELHWIVEHGAKVFLIRLAPVPTWKGRRSFALRISTLLGGGAGSRLSWSGCTPPTRVPALPQRLGGHPRSGDAAVRPGHSPGFQAMSSYKSAVIDGCASIIGHGLATRFPKLRFAPTEFVEDWVRPFVKRAGEAYDRSPVLFDEDPLVVFRRNIFAHIFREPNPKKSQTWSAASTTFCGALTSRTRRVWPTRSATRELVESQFSPEDAAKVMGGNLARIMNVEV